MNKKTWFFQITGWTCIAGSITLFALAGTDILLASESFNSPIYYVPAALLGISGVCLAICAYIYYKKKKQKKETINIFDILSKYSGQITPNEFSQETGLDPDESKQKLDDMHKNGICRLYVTESGLLIYHFPDFEFDGIVSKH